jgi:hypothetical protein
MIDLLAGADDFDRVKRLVVSSMFSPFLSLSWL